ncbi:MAG: hypothetical protein D6744_05670, partial [Planctomycetota bacterium]
MGAASADRRTRPTVERNDANSPPASLSLRVISAEEAEAARLPADGCSCQAAAATSAPRRATDRRAVSDHPEFGRRLADLDWIDEFAANVRPYVRVRPEDGVLIKMPTEAFQMNPTGLRLLSRVLGGERIREVALSEGCREHAERVLEIHRFFCDVRDLLSNHLGTGIGRAATNVRRFEGSFTRFPVLSEIAVTYRCNLACTFCYAGCGTGDASPGNEARERHRNWWKFWRRWAWWRRRHAKRDPIKQEMTREEVFEVIDQIALVG